MWISCPWLADITTASLSTQATGTDNQQRASTSVFNNKKIGFIQSPHTYISPLWCFDRIYDSLAFMPYDRYKHSYSSHPTVLSPTPASGGHQHNPSPRLLLPRDAARWLPSFPGSPRLACLATAPTGGCVPGPASTAGCDRLLAGLNWDYLTH